MMDTVVKGRERARWRDWLATLGRRRPRPRLSKVERALIGANGKALTMLATALQARGQLDVQEFAEVLGIFSVVVGEDSDLEGMILAVWADMVREVAEMPRT